MARKKDREAIHLVVPLDASDIEDFKAEQDVKVLLKSRQGKTYSQTVKLGKTGKSEAKFEFDEPPGALKVLVGPENASDEELEGMQTLSLDISARQFEDRQELVLPPIRISAYYWYWWLRWCRTFTIRGRVVCPDGKPVPGAKVCAEDVDYWWWWAGKQQVGCATTDASGVFELKFRWCCGWWPWWWWRHRVWQLEPRLIDKILPELQREPKLYKIPLPDPKPDFGIFADLLEVEEDTPRDPIVDKIRNLQLIQKPSLKKLERADMMQPDTDRLEMVRPTTLQRTRDLDASLLDQLREPLKARLPVIPELERLQLWPWYPWHPWWDCTPDIIFHVTQTCLGTETVIVDEGFSDTRWNIPSTLNVTLVANSEACCVEPQDDPEGVCMVLSHACDDPVQYIGGNVSAAANPAGYRNPGSVSIYGDRPFAGTVPLRGLFGDLANVDYYEFEWSDDAGTSWNSMPAAAAGGFSRTYWGPALGGGPVDFHSVGFSFNTISGQRVIESREHFEANNEPASWGLTRFWTSHRDLLMRWLTPNLFSDDTYHLRVRSWDVAAGNLVNPRILPLCNTTDDNGMVLAIDNQVATSGPTCPNGHPCGSGTVHKCTAEPDTDFLDVRILHNDGTHTNVGACGNVPIQDSDLLQIDFIAHDPDGHLSYYTLRATYGDSLVNNLLSTSLLSHPASSLAASPVAAPVAPAAQVGPYYGHGNAALSALDQGASSPTWHGGAMRLVVPAKLVFPESCCYQLELRAHKRTIVSCNDSLWNHINYSEYSFMIQV